MYPASLRKHYNVYQVLYCSALRNIYCESNSTVKRINVLRHLVWNRLCTIDAEYPDNLFLI